MLDKDMGQWQPQMVVKPILHLAEGCSPAHAMDKNGPTAVFKTVQNYQHMKLPVVFY
mgnify:CR=1 FL=1